jgi:Carboxypeptidase regulatory-like domain/TonB dependent receptor
VVYLKVRVALVLCFVTLMSTLSLPRASAQQTLGGIVGTVTDSTGSTLPGVAVKVENDGTHLIRNTESNSSGSYAFPNLPIGTYTLTFTRAGFSIAHFPGINVQADRTLTLPAQLAVGTVADSVTVEASPLMNAVDTTNGYVLDKSQIENAPLPTGSFTGLATLATGVSAELPGGTGVNSGLGNAPIWANGQRDTSNTFQINGVDASNLFNGKSTSQVASARVVNNTGVGNSSAGGVTQSSASVYLSIGNALPTPAPETIQEVRVNASMYDAEQGATSGAHIDLSTASGTNIYHGSAYLHRGTDWLNAAPFFFKQDGNIPENMKVPQLHRYTAGGTFGGPIIKDKLFGFVAYQHLHVSDSEIGDSFLTVPVGLTNDRSATALANLSNNAYGTTLGPSDINNVALALFNSPAAPGQPGKYLIPNSTTIPTTAHTDDAFIPGTAYFTADQAVADLDYNATSKDTISLKYFYQHDPTIAPYAYSNVPGFTQHLDAGSHVFSISNTFQVNSKLSTVESLGYIREKLYSTNEQLFGPGSIPTSNGVPTASMNTFGSTYFPGATIVDVLGSYRPDGSSEPTLNIGPAASTQGPNTGVFQNRLQPSANAIWALGKHTVAFGGSYEYTQLNTIDHRPGTGTVATTDFSQFAQGLVTNNFDFNTTTFLQGNANRYYRANQLGLFLQDKYQVTPNLSISAGVRWDWNGGLTEKYGRIFNFDPARYNYKAIPGEMPGTIDTSENGFIIAGNNVNGTQGVSNTTLTGRQWGLGPRIGAAWSPAFLHDKVVVRAGTGMYYDRGELFTYFSPGYAIGDVTGGPFGVNQAPPFVNSQICQTVGNYYQGYIPTCDPTSPTGGSLNNPWGNTLGPPPTGKASDITNYLPNLAALAQGAAPASLGVYDRANKLPYSINYTFDIQWQPRNDIAIDIGYVGNVGRHQVIPVPFNQAGIATPSGPIHGQQYSYGYTVVDEDFDPINLPREQGQFLANYEGGNVDMRVPYTGYASESIDYKAAGVAAYNALAVHLDKRLSHGFQIGASYTYSHALDEQSGLGLFYNGNNPLNLRDGYASSDFDRTHTVNINFLYRLPQFVGKNTVEGKFVDGWSVVGLVTLQSGQPYSVIDYTGAVGSIYYSVFNGITNPIVPLAPGCTPKNAKTGASGAFQDAGGNPIPALKASCFTLPLLAPGDLGGAVPAGDTFETNFTTGQRNIFRQSAQRVADISIAKDTQLTERFNLRYTFDIYNLTNTTSFDIPVDNVSQNENYDNFPTVGTTPLPTGCSSNPPPPNSSFYNCPGSLGITEKAIGSPRQIQMSLRLIF